MTGVHWDTWSIPDGWRTTGVAPTEPDARLGNCFDDLDLGRILAIIFGPAVDINEWKSNFTLAG